MKVRKRAAAIAAALTLVGGVSFVAAVGSASAAAPALTAPAQLGADGLTLHWSTDPSANQYQVQTQNSAGVLTATVNEPFWTPQFTAASGTARWRVASQSAAGGRVWSPWSVLGGVTPPTPTPTPTTPTPTPTTPTPTPTTPTPTPTSPSPTTAACVTSSTSGNCGPFNDASVFTSSNGADLVTQNDFSAIPQTLSADNSTSWNVAASTVGQSDQTSVKSYPATQVTYTLTNGKPDPSSDFGSALTSSFTNVPPSGANQDYEYAADDWLADPTKASWTNDLEIMIWTHTNGQRPAGSDSGKVYTDAAGTQWEVWVSGGATTVSPDSTVSFVRKTNTDSSSFERFGFYKYLQANGMLAATYGIDQLNYGLEICSTGGGTKTYGVTGYSTVRTP